MQSEKSQTESITTPSSGLHEDSESESETIAPSTISGVTLIQTVTMTHSSTLETSSTPSISEIATPSAISDSPFKSETTLTSLSEISPGEPEKKCHLCLIIRTTLDKPENAIPYLLSETSEAILNTLPQELTSVQKRHGHLQY